MLKDKKNFQTKMLNGRRKTRKTGTELRLFRLKTKRNICAGKRDGMQKR